jgi:hypothetical protein
MVYRSVAKMVYRSVASMVYRAIASMVCRLVASMVYRWWPAWSTCHCWHSIQVRTLNGPQVKARMVYKSVASMGYRWPAWSTCLASMVHRSAPCMDQR